MKNIFFHEMLHFFNLKKKRSFIIKCRFFKIHFIIFTSQPLSKCRVMFTCSVSAEKIWMLVTWKSISSGFIPSIRLYSKDKILSKPESSLIPIFCTVPTLSGLASFYCIFLPLFWWQRLITFGPSIIRVDTENNLYCMIFLGNTLKIIRS